MILQMNNNAISDPVLKQSEQNTVKIFQPNMTQSPIDQTKKAFESNLQNEFGNLKNYTTNNIAVNEI